ncbi:hypothetical protein ABBQ32_004717 [Trebouxia sp. C0010 RCD-2024]
MEIHVKLHYLKAGKLQRFNQLAVSLQYDSDNILHLQHGNNNITLFAISFKAHLRKKHTPRFVHFALGGSSGHVVLPVVVGFVVFDDMLRSNTRRGRAPADNSDVLAMFRLVYSGEGATQPLVDESSLTKEQKWQLLFDRVWRNLASSSQTKWLVYLRKWKKWIDDHPEQPEGYLVFPSSKVSAFLSRILADCTASSSKDSQGAVKSARKAL